MAAIVALLYSSACRHGVSMINRVQDTAVKPAGAVHHRSPVYRLDNGLGSPIA